MRKTEKNDSLNFRDYAVASNRNSSHLQFKNEVLSFALQAYLWLLALNHIATVPDCCIPEVVQMQQVGIQL